MTQCISAAVIGALSPAAILATIAILAAEHHPLRNAQLALVGAIDLCILVPLVIYVLVPRRAAHVLGAGRTWLVAHLAAVTAGSLLGFGVPLTVSGALHLLT